VLDERWTGEVLPELDNLEFFGKRKNGDSSYLILLILQNGFSRMLFRAARTSLQAAVPCH
jgi:hypothetical protein